MEFYLMLTLAILTAVTEQRPLILITAPNIVHLGVEETVTVQLHGATRSADVELYYEDQQAYRTQTILSNIVFVSLNEENNYQTVVKLKVEPTNYRIARSKPGGQRPYVTLVAKSPEIFQSPKKLHITLSTKKGYIFIQTDKPIYTPSEIVNYRIFTLDNYMVPSDESVKINIFNSKGLMVYNAVKKTNQILKQHITIPDVEPAGTWKIVASFTDFPMSNSSAEFEVKEYVLPSFEVKIELSKPYIIMKEVSFPFNISARYTYGKGVNGIAYVRFGVIDEQGNRVFLPGTEIQTSIKDGQGYVSLLTTSLNETARNRNITYLEGCRLYIAVTTFESASGELEETESSIVKIVTTPYSVDLSKTKLYFVPGGAFSVLATTTYPDGTPVPNLKMKAVVHLSGGNEREMILDKSGNKDGEVVFTFQVPEKATSLDVKVIAEGESGDISDGHITAAAFQSQSKSYLSIEVQHILLGPNEDMTVTFRDIKPPGTANPIYIYYLMVSKGMVIQASRVRRTSLTRISLPFSYDMVPAFRLIAYYFTEHQGEAEMIADSVWVDVKDVCKGKIQVTTSRENYKPREWLDITIKTDQAEKVALSAVDTAVYILNKLNKLTPTKVFSYMNSYDLGCSVGGGEDTINVFRDAGLTFLTNFKMAAKIRIDHMCKNGKVRPKRAYNYNREFSAIVNQYSDAALKKCCNDGAKLSLMKHSCEKRVTKTRHKSSECQRVFLDCCKKANDLREYIKKTGRGKMGLARIEGSEEENVIDETSVHLRSYFPQTWLWKIFDVPKSGLFHHQVNLPDSITSWELQTIGISKRKGFCVAEPTQFTVFQDFFVSLKLPYSVKRNEQLEVKAVVYNYQPESREVTVTMKTVKEICSAGNVDGKQVITVPGNSAVPVYFAVVPLEVLEIPIHVVAYSSSNVSDAIKKTLKVLGEGVLLSEQAEYNINATDGKKLEIDIPSLDNSIPGIESEAFVSIKGGVMGESVENCLNLEGVDKLIQLPKGCAEQTMVTMSPAIHAMRYLDATEQWIYLKAERKDEAIEMIQNGYNRILTFKKDDGSYGAFSWTPSSVWLTAFIAKELTRTRRYIDIENEYIRQSVFYLISQQLESGAFHDQHPVYDRTMQGGVGVFEGDLSLTSFVIIAMHHSTEVLQQPNITEVTHSINKAVQYLEQKLDSIQRPFTIAITAYALSLTKLRSAAATKAQQKLRDLAKCDEEKKICHWEGNGNLQLKQKEQKSKDPQADSISVETTAYALLQTLLVEDRTYATSVAKWLTEQRRFGGGFRSTQDTVVALEALAEYSIMNLDLQDFSLTVELCHGKGKKDTVSLTKINALTEPTHKVRPGSKLVVNVAGKGSGTLTLVQIYRTMKVTDSACDYFHLHVSLQGEVQYNYNDYGDNLDDYYNYDSIPSADEPMSRIEWFDLHTRRQRREIDTKEKESSVLYTVCVNTIGRNSSGMVIVDISLLSGLEPKTQDLEDLVKSTDKYLDHYDLDKGKLFLYFNEITDTQECVTFAAKQIAPVGLVQPANAVIYDYYNPGRRCNVFYSAPRQSPMVSKLCSKDVCVCAEGRCPKIKSTFSKNMNEDTRRSFACYKPIVDYVYVVTVLNTTHDGVFEYFAVKITKPLRISKDEAIQTGHLFRNLVKRHSCEFSMKVGKAYLVMGKDGETTDTTDTNGNIQYFLNHETWVEEIPEEGKCKASKSRKACSLLHDFMQEYEINQCRF